MHRISVIGISWRHAAPATLQQYTIAREHLATRLPALAATIEASELVYVATCNRVEVSFVGPTRGSMADRRARLGQALCGSPDAPTSVVRGWRTWNGEAAAEHLLLTAAGLDSALIGEQEIATQMRNAVEESRALGLLGPALGPVFTGAFRAARRVRPVLEGADDERSLADFAMRYLRERLDAAPGRVALVGVSAMTERCAHRLAAQGVPLLIVNRTFARAEALARHVGGEARALDAFRDDPGEVEAVVLATGAPEPVLGRSHLERLVGRSRTGRSPLIIDFGVPPNIAPRDAAAADVRRIGMEHLTVDASDGRARRQHELTDARVIVDEELRELRRTVAERLVSSAIAQLRLRYRRTVLEGLERLFNHDLAGVGVTERERIRRWAETLAHRFAHAPSVGLRDLVFEMGPRAVETFFASSEPALAAAVRESAELARMEMTDGGGGGA